MQRLHLIFRPLIQSQNHPKSFKIQIQNLIDGSIWRVMVSFLINLKKLLLHNRDLSGPTYILVSCLCLPDLCPVTFVLDYYVLSIVYTLFHILLATYPYLLDICIVFCYNYPLTKYILQLILVLSCSSCTSLLPYIPSLWVQFVLAFLEALSVYLPRIYSFVLGLLNYILVIH